MLLVQLCRSALQFQWGRLDAIKELTWVPLKPRTTPTHPRLTLTYVGYCMLQITR